MAKDNLDELLEQAEETLEKGGDLGEIETEHHGKVKEHEKKESVEDKIKHAKMEAGQEEVTEDTQEAVEAGETEEKPRSAKASRGKKGKAKVRGVKYIKALELVDRNKKYEIAEALELAKKTSLTKFDGNIEVHIRLQSKSGKSEQIRGMISYPHATGKSLNVVILDDKIIEEIAKSGKVEADIYLATPADMPKVARLAKILGPKGKMPNPKSGTITDDPVKTKAELEGGKTEYKTDSYGIIHQVIGKVSVKVEDLEANYKTLISVLPIEKITSINLSATMAPGIKIQK